MRKTAYAAAVLVAMTAVAPPMLVAAAHAQGTAPMQDAGAAGEHSNAKGMKKAEAKKSSMSKKHTTKKAM